MAGELEDVLQSYCRTIQRLLVSYEETNDPDKLDSLTYHTNRLHRILLTLNTCSFQVLELISVSLSLLEDLNSSQDS